MKKPELMAVLDAAATEGKSRTANMLLTDLRQMFRFGLDREIVSHNPLSGILKKNVGGKESERSRVLSEAELRELGSAIPGSLPERSARAVWLILATACRVGEAAEARWEHVDLVKRTWYLPTTKNQRDHKIHLSRFAIAQFEAQAALRDAEHTARVRRGEASDPSLWVLPGRDWRKPSSPKTLAKQLGDRQRGAEERHNGRTKATRALILPGGHWTPHDLRRTAATLIAGLGFGSDVIDECLNHKIQSKTARTYIRDRRLEEQARAFDALGAKLETLTAASQLP